MEIINKEKIFKLLNLMDELLKKPLNIYDKIKEILEDDLKDLENELTSVCLIILFKSKYKESIFGQSLVNEMSKILRDKYCNKYKILKELNQGDIKIELKFIRHMGLLVNHEVYVYANTDYGRLNLIILDLNKKRLINSLNRHIEELKTYMSISKVHKQTDRVEDLQTEIKYKRRFNSYVNKLSDDLANLGFEIDL